MKKCKRKGCTKTFDAPLAQYWKIYCSPDCRDIVNYERKRDRGFYRDYYREQRKKAAKP